MIYHDDIATRVELYDARHRELDVTHFAGNGTMTLMMPQTRHREACVDGRLARELAHLFDHFSRHGQLPITFPEPDYMI
jgi:hypothetical protein